MAQTGFTCTLTRADEPACQSYAQVTIMGSEGALARGCPWSAVPALDSITGAYVDWSDSGPQRMGAQGLELVAGRSQLG
jgi:hypothetical protein